MTMRRCVYLFFAAILCISCQKYDDTEVKGLISSLEYRIKAVETVLNASAAKAYVVSVKEEGGSYLITFSNGTSATFSSGSDGKTSGVLVDYVNDCDSYMMFFFEDGRQVMVPKVNYISVSLTKKQSEDDTTVEYAYKVTSFVFPLTFETLCSEDLKVEITGSSDVEGTLSINNITNTIPSGYIWLIVSNGVNVSMNKLEL